MKLWLFLGACCAALALPAGAAAVTCAPPGNSGVNQYFEVVPGSSCNHAPGGPGSGSSGGGHGTLPSSTSQALSKQGAVGQAVKALVASSGTASSESTSGSRPRSAGSHASKHASGAARSGNRTHLSGSGRGPLSAILHPILTGSSSGGMGVLLPVLLLAALVAVLGAVVLRRRLSSPGPPT